MKHSHLLMLLGALFYINASLQHSLVGNLIWNSAGVLFFIAAVLITTLERN